MQQVPHAVHTDEIQIGWIIGSPAQIPLILLGVVEVHKILIGVGAQREGALAALCFRNPVSDNRFNLVVDFLFDHSGGNRDASGLKVDCRPAQAQELGAAQAVEAGQEDRHRNGLVLGGLEKLGHLLNAVGLGPVVLDPFGPVGEVSHILPNVPMLHRPLQGRADDGMMLDHRVWVETIGDLEGVVVLQISGGHAADGDFTGVKIGDNVQIQNVDILIISRDGNVGLVYLDPGGDMPAQQRIHGFDVLDALILYQKLVEHGFRPPLVALDIQAE